MAQKRFRNPLVMTMLIAAAAFAGCDGSKSQATCPTTAPNDGDPCTSVDQVCDYKPQTTMYTCTESGKWRAYDYGFVAESEDDGGADDGGADDGEL